MKPASKAYNVLWTLIDKENIHLKTLDFSAVCERIGANEKELEAILLRELGYTGYELLVELRRRHFQPATEPDSASPAGPAGDYRWVEGMATPSTRM